ncbi:hypothetical protein BH20ACI2_BH20ACI2_05360 [soil metagenome]
MDFYYSFVDCSEDNTSTSGTFWTWASHLGEAIHKIQSYAQVVEIKNPIVRLIDFYDFDELPEKVFTAEDGETFVADEFCSFPTEYCYKLPVGVVLSFEEGEFEDTQIKLGYGIDALENGLIEIEAVVDESDILPIYAELISVLPEITAFWLKFADDWEEPDIEEMYVNEELLSVESIQNYVELNKPNTLQNGHITITTYSNEGQTNVNISDHKTLVVLTYSKKLIAKFHYILKKRGLRKKTPLISVAGGFHHWHYRHHESLNRQGSIEKLKKQGFRKWDDG